MKGAGKKVDAARFRQGAACLTARWPEVGRQMMRVGYIFVVVM